MHTIKTTVLIGAGVPCLALLGFIARGQTWGIE